MTRQERLRFSTRTALDVLTLLTLVRGLRRKRRGLLPLALAFVEKGNRPRRRKRR